MPVTPEDGLSRTYAVPGLATISLDTRDNFDPLLEITLDPSYRGDLNDLARENPYPDGVYLRCNSTGCINDPDLARFMEALSHWDHDHDGKFDADEIADAIENAMWMSREKPNEFHRPDDSVFARMLMRMMPPAPVRHIVFGYGELKRRFKWYHYIWAILTLLAVFGLIQLQIYLMPFTKYSVVTGAMAIGEAMGLSPTVAFILVMALLVSWPIVQRRLFPSKNSGRPSNISPHTYGLFNKAAVVEEQIFREGSENWNVRQRAVSCAVFGVIHMANLIYPIATILPLSLAGAVFMVVYLRVYRKTKFRRSAVLAAAVVHRVYNRLALIALGVTPLILLGWGALALFGVLAIMAAVSSATFKQGAEIEPKRSITPVR